MGELSTATLHERADQAAQRGDFIAALRNAGEGLRVAPLDPKARIKVALCFAMLTKGEVAQDIFRTVAVSLGRRGYMLSAIGACRDALGMVAESPPILEVLKGIHARIHGQVGRGRARVPPPTPPVQVAADADGSLLTVEDDAQLLERAAAIATTDPTAGEPDAEPGFVPFFSDMSLDAFLELVAKMGYHKVGTDHVVVREGDPGTSLFILLSGEVMVSRGEGDDRSELARLGSGSLFGEMSLITAKPRTATVVTTQAAEYFEIDRAIVEEVAVAHPAVSEEIVKFARKRLLMNMMATSKIFKAFESKERLAILRLFTSRVAEAGTVLIEEGQDAKGLYVVLEGEVEVSKIDDAGDPIVLAYLKQGDVFGEVSLIGARKTIAKVTTTEKSVVFYLDKDTFDALAIEHPKVHEYLSTLSEERLEETEDAMSAEGVILDADDLIIL